MIRRPLIHGLALLLGLAALWPRDGLAQAATAAAASAPAAAASDAAPAAAEGLPASSAASGAEPTAVRLPALVSEPAAAPPVQAPWLADPLGADGWRYSAALEALGGTAQAQALRRVLLRHHLDRLTGLAPRATGSVAQAIADGGSMRPADVDPELRGRWAEAVNQHLRAVIGTAPVPVPPELEADAQRLREAAPGLWSLHAPDGNLRGRVWWLTLRNQSTLALPLGEFRVRAPAGALHTVFDCSLPRYAEMNLALPGRETPYLCRANAGAGTPRAWDELARLLRSSRTLPLQLEPMELSSPASSQSMALRLEMPFKAGVDALVAAASAASAAAAAAATPAGPAAARAASAPGPAVRQWADRLRLGGAVLAAIVVFSLVASMAGMRAGLLISWLLLTGLTLVALIKGLPWLSPWLPKAPAGASALSPLRIVSALGLPLVATLVLALCHVLLFGERIGILRGLAARITDFLADGVVDRIFSRGRY